MADQLKNTLILAVVIFGLILLWVASIGFTYWDAASRRKLAGIETAAWVGLVVVIPGIGFAAYLFSRLLGSALSPKPTVVEQRQRVTLLKRQFEPEQRSGTVPAAEFLKSTTTETTPIPQPKAGSGKTLRKFV